MIEEILKIRDLRVEYKTDLETIYAVNGINLNIEKGKTLGIVGETGAGKTTTALSILRLLPERSAIIRSGSIEFKGKKLFDLSEERMSRSIRGEKISMIFQDPMTSLNPVIRVGDQILEMLQLHNYKKMSQEGMGKRVDELLRMVGIEAKRKNEYPHQFSGGMRQRVVIAIALACEPEILIADEPTTALDVTIQDQVLNMINNLKTKFNMSMILITHDLGVVVNTCDNVAIMYAGEIIEYGTIENIFETGYHHPYTEGLFGSIPKINDKRNRLNPIPGSMPDPSKLPAGCSFYMRCPKHMDICKSKKPQERDINETHFIKCHLFK